jgi:citronellyl-CoA synthetase
MAGKGSEKKEYTISLWDVVSGWLSLCRRLPAIILTLSRINRIAADNRESWGSMLEETARKYPKNIAVKSKEAWLTYEQYNAQVNRYAHYFLSLGLQKGDVVALFLETRPELLIIYSALAKIGAVNAMINTNLRQEALRHCLTLNPARGIVVGEELVEPFEEVQESLSLTPKQKLFFSRDKGENPVPDGFGDLANAVMDFSETDPSTTPEVKPKDALAYVFTSGTTGGLPKAAIVSHGRVVRSRYFNGKIVLNLMPDDTMYVPLPFFHTNALALSWPTVFSRGSALAVRRRFSVSHFWEDVREYKATAWCYVGELCRYLINQPPKPDDLDNPLTMVIGNGLRPDIWKAFQERFGISKVFEIYGAAESNLYFVNMLNLYGTVGTCRAPHVLVRYDVQEDEPIRDKNGFMQKVKKHETGLLLGEITAETPFLGYTSPEATEAKILRNVFAPGDAWFNTGDLLKDLGFGHLQFVDRTGDTFRWKGENVSTTEVEKVINSFPGISISTVYGVLMPGGDGRAGMAAILTGVRLEEFNFSGLLAYFNQALPSYAVPKFLRFPGEFEYTPTHKIKKVNLKKEGFDPGQIKDPLFVLLPGETAYRPMTEELCEAIMEGRYKY